MTLQLPGPLLLVGAGKMGGAMLHGWLEAGMDPASVAVLDPGPPTEIAALLADNGITLNPAAGSMAAPAVMLLAVKPQMMGAVLASVAPRAGPQTLVISIAAGWTIANFADHFGAGAPIIRVMPNTPAAIGAGMMVCCPNAAVSDDQRALCDALMRASGDVAWLDDEGLMDAVTAVSGSGPAYVFALTEALAEAGVAAGLPSELAGQLARQTVSGAGALMAQSSEAPATLRKNVTSPGGTTAAALAVLMAPDNLPRIMRDAVLAAKTRGKELGG